MMKNRFINAQHFVPVISDEVFVEGLLGKILRMMVMKPHGQANDQSNGSSDCKAYTKADQERLLGALLASYAKVLLRHRRPTLHTSSD